MLCGDLNNGPGSALYQYAHLELGARAGRHMRSSFSHYAAALDASGACADAIARMCFNPRTSGVYADVVARDAAPSGCSAHASEAPDMLTPCETSDAVAAAALGEPHCTTVNYRRCWSIDFVLYSCHQLAPVGLMRLPTEEELRSEIGPDGWDVAVNQRREKTKTDPPLDLARNNSGIPNSHHGSDHIPVVADFDWLL